jgi:hypothetical protein
VKNKILLASVLTVTAFSVLAATYSSGLLSDNNLIATNQTIFLTEQPVVPTQFQTNPLVNLRPKVELVFALDTTSSMSGLINAAKEKIWSIASTMASAQPAPEISIGLVAYRDRGDAYVTKRINLSQDLDAVYAQLLDLKAEGGGDGPESVNAALYEAINLMNWSENNDSYKVVFLVGDAPGHQDYQNDTPFEKSVELAAKKGIIVNTIQAGKNPNMVKEWQKIAVLGYGDSFHVDQQGSSIAIATPFDQAIVIASEKFEKTRVYYGEAEEQELQQQKLELTGSRLKKAASIESMARRAKYNASKSGEKNFAAGKELLQAIENDELELADIPESELPMEMRAMAIEEKIAFVAAKVKERKESKAKLKALSVKRDTFIKQVLDKNKNSKESLDQKLYATLKRQAEKKGLDYSAAEDSY